MSAAALVKYLNVSRTFRKARALYIPTEKINTPLYYFKSTQTKILNYEKWREYCRQPLKFYQITGNHYSIFRLPQVSDFAGTFGSILKEKRGNLNES